METLNAVSNGASTGIERMMRGMEDTTRMSSRSPSIKLVCFYFLILGLSFPLPWASINISLSRYTAIFGTKSYIYILAVYNLLALPILVIQHRFSQKFVKHSPSIVTYSVRTVVSMLVLTAATASVPFLPDSLGATLGIVSIIGLASGAAFGSLYHFSALFPVIVNAFLFIGVTLSAFLALISYEISGFEVHPSPEETLYYFGSIAVFVFLTIGIFILLALNPATTYYMNPSTDLEERISFIEAEGEQYSMKNLSDLRPNYPTKIPVHKIIWPSLVSVFLSQAITITVAGFYPMVPNQQTIRYPLANWLVIIGITGDIIGRESSLFLKHLIKTSRRLLIVTILRALIFIVYVVYIFKHPYESNLIAMLLVTVLSFLGGFATTSAYGLGSAAVDLNSKSTAVTHTTASLVGGVFFGLLFCIVLINSVH